MHNDYNKKLTLFPISKLFPNIVTVMSICFGLTAIRYALDEKWEIAVSFIVIAGFLDVIDGRLARFLKATSNFGAQLDSLADFVNFGISPAIILYLWELKKISVKGLGWAFALFFAVCAAIRLARFNSDLAEQDKPAWKEGFFTGVPSTAGAYLSMIPIMLSFKMNFMDYVHPILIGLYAAIIAALMASKLPTFATKKIIIHKEYISLTLALVGLLVAIIIMEPWFILPFLGIIYLFSLPFSFTSFKRKSLSKVESSNNR